MRKTLTLAVFVFCLAFSLKVHATDLSWSSSDVSGTDPLGHEWKFSNLYPQAAPASGSWNLPPHGFSGGATFLGDFIKDFHITFDLSNFADQEIMVEGQTWFWEITGSSIDPWVTQFIDTDSDQRIDTVWFFAPPGKQVSNGEKFLIGVQFELPWIETEGILVTPSFNAQWTDSGVIPEPSTMILFASGLGLLGLAAWRRKKA